MDEQLEVKGVWWLPNDPDKKIFGVLTYTQEDGAYLNTFGSFTNDLMGDMERPEIILGESQNAKPITLADCIQISYNHSFNGAGESTYFAHMIFDGIHFQTPDDMKFHEIYAKYFNFDGWVNVNGFSIIRNFENDNYSYDIKYTKPKLNYYDINEKFSVGIGISVQGPTYSRVQSNVYMEQKTFLNIKSRNGDIAFDDMFKVLNIYKDLFQLGIQSLPFIQSLKGLTSVDFSESKINRDGLEEIDIYYQPIEVMRYKKPKLPAEMLFTYSDLTKEQLVNWYSLFNEYQSVINLYRGLFYQERLFIDVKFLNIAEALESLHNILFENQVLTKSEFNKRKKMIINSVPEEYHVWLNGVFLNANYKAYQYKILELLERKKDFMSELVDDFEQFSKKVRDTRNQYVHNSDKKLSFKSGKELFDAIFILTILFESYLFELIGFDDEKIAELLKPKIKSIQTGWKHLREF